MKISRMITVLVMIYGLCIMNLFAQEPQTKLPEAEELEVSENVTLDFKDADIKSVLKIISYKSGINIVATPEVVGSVSIRLEDLHWEKALNTIVRTYGFGYEWLSDKVIIVSTLEKLAEQRRIQQEAATQEPVDTQVFALNFSKAEEVRVAIEKLISQRGKVALEARTNTVIVTDTKSNLIKIGKVIEELDRVTPQVLIEAKIIETNLDRDENLGIDWGIAAEVGGSTRPTTFPFTTDSENKYLPDGIPAYTTAPGTAGSLFTLGTLDASGFTAALEILFTDVNTELLSNPRIVTLDNQTATIEVVTLDPTPKWTYNEEQNVYVMTDYRQEKYGIILEVTPQINKLGYVTLSIKPEVSEKLGDKALAGGSGLVVNLPIIYKQTTSTTVMVKDGDTLVIGGLIKKKTTDTIRKVPILGDIPILGYLFKHKAKEVENKDLLIFITPRIITIQAS